MIISLKEYTWQKLRTPLLLSWFVISLIATLTFIASLWFFKNEQLKSTLSVSAKLASDLISLRDWDLAYSSLENVAQKNNITKLKIYSTDETLLSVLGVRNSNLVKVCKSLPIQKNIKIQGCTSLFNLSHIAFVIFSIIISLLTYIVSGFILKANNDQFVGQISFFLKSFKDKEGVLKLDSKLINELLKIEDLKIIYEEFQMLLEETKRVAELKATSKISAQLAHDIRSPLTLLKIVSDKVPMDSTHKNILVSAIERTNNLAEELLKESKNLKKYEKSNEGPECFQNQHTKLTDKFNTEIFNNIFESKKLEYTDRNVKVFYHNHLKGNIDCIGSKTNIERVISNVMNNSVDAVNLKKDGFITINSDLDFDQVRIEIRDNGVGIPESDIENVTREGYSSGKSDGFGLGLYSANSIMESFGGELNITSRKDIGTTVTLKFPIYTSGSRENLEI